FAKLFTMQMDIVNTRPTYPVRLDSGAVPRLLLIRHSESAPVEGVSPEGWGLTEEGRRRCAALAERLRGRDLPDLVASHEPKAAQTARLVAERLGLPWQTAEGLHEHERDAMPWLGREHWEARIAELFRRPDRLVFGRETARAALERFAAALEPIAAARPGADVAIVTHGTVLTLFVARHNPVDPLAFWKALAMPDLVELELPSYRLIAGQPSG
ncbi:MAG TPA: histidine phosphatase family protein, partial [Chloroflexota bacterium]